MIKVEVINPGFTTKDIKRKTDGKQFSFREQEAWAFLTDANGKPQPYPQRMLISLGDNQEPYKPGVYHLAPSSLFVGDFGSLQIGRVALVPAAK
jgi:hypothetical protein